MEAVSVKIECDEDGLHLIIDGDSPDENYTAAILDYRIQDIDLDRFYENVRNTVGGYLRERDEALRTRPTALYEDQDAYDLLDPKHPTFRDRMTAIWDIRNKTEPKPW